MSVRHKEFWGNEEDRLTENPSLEYPVPIKVLEQDSLAEDNILILKQFKRIAISNKTAKQPTMLNFWLSKLLVQRLCRTGNS